MTTDPLLVSSSGESSADVLVSQLLADFQEQYGLDLAQDPAAVQRIKEAVESGLRTLQHQSEVEIYLPYISANAAGPIHLQRVIQRHDSNQDKEGSSGDELTGSETESTQRVQVPLPDHKPVVTTIFLVLMALIYALQILTEILFLQDLPAALGMKINQAILEGEYWRLVTPMFLHGSVIHLGFNLYALYILGRRIERFFGSFRFVLLFLIAGVIGNLFSFFFTPAASLGSSTAIFGLLAAEGVFIYNHRELFGNRSQVALRQIIQVAVINFIIGLSPGIDNWGHLGGFIGGVLFSWFAGPMLKFDGNPPLVRFVDSRAEKVSIQVFLLLLILVISLTAVVIRFRY